MSLDSIARIVTALEDALAPLRSERCLVGLDIDGTLVNHAAIMDPRVRDALRAAVAAGHEVVVATGRSLGSTLPISRVAGISSGWAVSSNGGVITRIHGMSGPEPELDTPVGGLSSGKPVFDTHALGYALEDFTFEHVSTFNPSEALAALYTAVPNARFAVERADGSFHATESFQDASFGLEAQHMPIEVLLHESEVVRVVVTAPDMPTEEFARLVAEAGVHGCQYAIGWSSWLDMSAPGITKASALEWIRQREGIAPEHTIAVGDGSNDVEMLRWAAVGVAMGQASADTIAAANLTTCNVDDHGGALVLETLARHPAERTL